MEGETLQLMAEFGKRLIFMISERQIQVLEADLDDVLIDLEASQVVEIVRVFANFVETEAKSVN